MVIQAADLDNIKSTQIRLRLTVNIYWCNKTIFINFLKNICERHKQFEIYTIYGIYISIVIVDISTFFYCQHFNNCLKMYHLYRNDCSKANHNIYKYAFFPIHIRGPQHSNNATRRNYEEMQKYYRQFTKLEFS